MKRVIPTIILLVISSVGIAQPKVILKLDDLGSRNGLSSAEPVLSVILQRKVKASIGVIAAQLDATAMQAYGKYIKATNAKGDKLFEIWNHGYNHSDKNPPNNNQEFNGTSYDFQLEHLNMATKRVKDLLGIQMHTFGSPYNGTDSTFGKVIQTDTNYKVSFYSYVKINPGGKLKNLNNRVDMESATGVVNFDYFLANYQKFKTKFPDLIVMQGHPNQWDAAKLVEFNKILDYLIVQKCEFVLPYNYYLSTTR